MFLEVAFAEKQRTFPHCYMTMQETRKTLAETRIAVSFSVKVRFYPASVTDAWTTVT